jgi:hypothetical protein
MSKEKAGFENSMKKALYYLNDHITSINNSKLFAGLMIITLNISSKFVTMKFSKTTEAYLKYTFSRDILIFAIAWMGTRDIYISAIVTIVFILCMDFLFHEDSPFCCFSEQFKNYHMSLVGEGNEDPDKITADDVATIQKILEKVKKCQSSSDSGNPAKSTGQQQTSNFSLFS